MIIALGILIYLAFGYIGALACLRSFERQFGSPQYGLALFIFLMGPWGAAVAFILGAYRWQVRLKARMEQGRLAKYIERTSK